MQTISQSAEGNQLNRLVRRVRAWPLPEGLRRRIVTLGAGLTVPYLRTSAIELHEVDGARVEVALKNRRKVQNHMKTVHASAMFLLAESATGTVLAANLPDGARFATTHIEIDYKRKARGDLKAVATLTEAQRHEVRTAPEGRLTVPVRLTDEDGNEPATFHIEWSWKQPRAARPAA